MARTALLSQLGDDALGLHVAALLAAEPDLDLTWLRCTPGFQSPVTVSLRPASTSASSSPTRRRRTRSSGRSADPGVGATHVSMHRDLPEWVARLRRQGTVIYGGVGWDSTGLFWSKEVLRRLDQIDVFVPNDLEAMRYTHTDDAYAAARELGRYVELAVVTRGARGAIAYERSTGRLTEVSSVRVARHRSNRRGRRVRRVPDGERRPGLAHRAAASAGRDFPRHCRSVRSGERRGRRIGATSRGS